MSSPTWIEVVLALVNAVQVVLLAWIGRVQRQNGHAAERRHRQQ